MPKVTVNQYKSLGLSDLRMSALRWDEEGGERDRTTHCGYSVPLGLGGAENCWEHLLGCVTWDFSAHLSLSFSICETGGLEQGTSSALHP